MSNASCADCGRIVAFRTSDPAEIAECRSCGTWVKRTFEMPGVAVRLSSSSENQAQLPARKTITPASPTPTTTSPTSNEPASSPIIAGAGQPLRNDQGEELVSAAAVYAAILELQSSIISLQAGQKDLHNATIALQSSQQEIQKSQKSILERTLPVSDMPSPDFAKQATSQVTAKELNIEAAPTLPTPTPSIPHFYTTRFSSLKVPIVPTSLEELGTSKEFNEEELETAPIPSAERTDLARILEAPLPEPEFIEPEKDITEPQPLFASEQAPPFEEVTEPREEPAAFQGLQPFTIADVQNTGQNPAASESSSEDPLSVDTPIPSGPFIISEPTEDDEAEEEAEIPPSESPFAYPFSAPQPTEIADPFGMNRSNEEELSVAEEEDNFEESADEEGEQAFYPELSDEDEDDELVDLEGQIAAAKEGAEESALGQYTDEELLHQPRKSRFVLFALGLALLGLAAFFLLGRLGKGDDEKDVLKPAPLIEFPQAGRTLSPDNPLVREAEDVALIFINSKTPKDLESVIMPVNPTLIENFHESFTAASITDYYRGRVLPNNRVEVDFLIKDYGQPERILPLVKIGRGPFLVDWKAFAECEELTLLSLTQGTLILDDNTESIDEGTIRSYVKNGKGDTPELDNENWQSFRLLNLTEETIAHAVVRKNKPEYQELTEALASTQLKHKGVPAIRAILRVKRIQEEDPETRKPASMEILDVVSTTWAQTQGSQSSPQAPLIPEATNPVPH